MASIDINKLIQESMTTVMTKTEESAVADVASDNMTTLHDSMRNALSEGVGGGTGKSMDAVERENKNAAIQKLTVQAKRGSGSMSDGDRTHSTASSPYANFQNAATSKRSSGSMSDGDRTHSIASSPYANFQNAATSKDGAIMAGLKKVGKGAKELMQDHPRMAMGAAGAAGIVGAGVMAKKYLARKKA